MLRDTAFEWLTLPHHRQSTWHTEGFREYHRKMQLFILLYIEGGSYINEEEDTWEFVVLYVIFSTVYRPMYLDVSHSYEKRTRRTDPSIVTYHFMGYSSLYPFYCYPEKVRLRLSQFVILPPFQHAGHGCTSLLVIFDAPSFDISRDWVAALYTAIYQYVLNQPQIAELTVEDPAEAFEDLRDRNDLRMLLGLEQFMIEGFGEGVEGHSVSHGRQGKGKGRAKGKMGPPVEKGWMEKWRVQLKIAGVRCVSFFSLCSR